MSAIPERHRWLDIIGAVLRQEDGALIDATACGSGVDCGDLEADCPQLVTAVSEVLNRYNVRDSSADLSLVTALGRAEVRGAQEIASVNAAQAALREVMSAVCSSELRSVDIAAIAYAEDALDADTAEDVWQLLLRLPDLVGAANSSTLIVIAGDGELRFSLHCQGNPSLRFHLSTRGLAERRTWRQNTLAIRDFGRHSAEDMPLVVMFLGAGASVAKNLPTGDTLRNQALGGLMARKVDPGNWRSVAREWYDDLAERGKLSVAEISSGVEQFVASLTLERVIAVEQDLEGQTNSTTLRAFARKHGDAISAIRAGRASGTTGRDALEEVLKKQQRLVLVTVNFDHVVETRSGGLVEPFYAEPDLLRFGDRLAEYVRTGGTVPLLKLHGDISNPDTIVANLNQTAAGLSSARDVALRTLVEMVKAQAQRPWFYVGYSMRDADLEVTWSAPDFVDAMNEYWVAPFLDPAVENLIKTRRLYRWQQSGRDRKVDDQLLTLVADDFYELFEAEVARRW